MSNSSNKNKLNQGFSSFDLITTIMAIALVAAIIIPILFKSAESRSLASVNQDLVRIAENLTKNISDGSVISNESGQRNMASVSPEFEKKWEGLISDEKDAWGGSYNYKVVRDVYGNPLQVIVWSKGPNNIQDTPDSELNLIGGTLRLQADDVGYAKTFN